MDTQTRKIIVMVRLFVWLVVSILFAAPVNAGETRSDYTLSFSVDSPRRFRVIADLPVTKNEIQMSTYLAEPLANGYADFLENLMASDAAGRPVQLTHLGKGRWSLDRPLRRVRLSYDVVLKHEQVKWRLTGLMARGYAAEEALFFFGHIAFVTGDPEFKLPAHISFKVPKPWKVASAWKEVKGKENVFEAKDLDTLLSAGTMVGRLSERKIKFGPLEVIISGPRSVEATIHRVGDPIEPVIRGYTRNMGGAPEGKFAFFFNVDRSHKGFLGAETLGNTISMLMDKQLDDTNAALYTYIIAHEAFHLWNAIAIAGANRPQSSWFSEGFSVYGATLELYRSGFSSEERLLKDIAEGYDTYASGFAKAAGKVSLKEAGTDRSKQENRDLIYYGGMVAAIALDIEGRSRLGEDNGGFIEMMRLAYEEFGRTGKRYTADDLIRLASESGGTDMSSFFARYVDGKEMIPLGDYLKLAGLILTTVDGKSTIARDPNATAAQRRIFPPSPPSAGGQRS